MSVGRSGGSFFFAPFVVLDLQPCCRIRFEVRLDLSIKTALYSDCLFNHGPVLGTHLRQRESPIFWPARKNKGQGLKSFSCTGGLSKYLELLALEVGELLINLTQNTFLISG